MTDPTAESIESAIEQRNQLLKEIDAASIHKAWFTLSHLLLDEGAKVVDMGCNDGAVTYAMATMNPKVKFIGLDKSKRQINKAKEIYQLHNLEYQIGDAVSELFEPESLDAVINSDVLHEVYSASRYNERIVSDTLRRHFKMLKKGGIMFIRDFAQPPEGEFVLLEMPDNPSTGNDLAGLSEADLLVWYSEHARPRQDPGCGGFFLEELPPRFPKTRLFRLPHKWAYEFLMRKDDRRHWETALPVEYTFYTLRDFRRELRNFGARVQYSGPHWEEDLIEKNFEKKNIRMYDDYGALLAPPPTCFIAVAVKLAERKSLNIEERRPSPAPNKLQVTALRDQKTGKLADVVSRGMDVSEILPYRIDETGKLKIYLHDGVAKSIVNAVPRSGVNLDQREWSGHMVEAMAVDNTAMADYQPVDTKSTVLFGRDYLGLRPQEGALLEKGPDYYPSPEYIDERIFTWYLKVEKARSVAMAPKNLIGHNDRFQAKGTIREFDAQQILNAITVGMIPNARLELQILCLFQHLGLPAENWIGKRLNLQAGKITENKSLRALLSSSGLEEKRFREIKGTSGQLRPVHSTFVEEAQTQGTIAGLSAQDVDFVIFDDRTVNTAVVLPLKMDMKSEIHAGFLLDQMPVPERREGNGMTATCFSFNLPPTVTNMKQAKKFVADKYGVLPEMIIKLGESYFSHHGITPQRIYPFAVVVPPGFLPDPKTAFLPFYQMRLLRSSLSRSSNFGIIIARAYRFLGEQAQLDSRLQLQSILRERFAENQPRWITPHTYIQAPILKAESPQAAPAPETAPEVASVIAPAKKPAVKKKLTDDYTKRPHKDAPLDTPPSPMQKFVPPALPAKDAALPRLIDQFAEELEEFFKEQESFENKPTLQKW